MKDSPSPRLRRERGPPNFAIFSQGVAVFVKLGRKIARPATVAGRGAIGQQNQSLRVKVRLMPMPAENWSGEPNSRTIGERLASPTSRS